MTPAGISTETHPRLFEPATLILVLLLSVFGAIIGLQLLTTLGVTPNTSMIGALVAIGLARDSAESVPPLPLHPRAELGAERDFGGDFRCREQSAAADRHPVCAWAVRT